MLFGEPHPFVVGAEDGRIDRELVELCGGFVEFAYGHIGRTRAERVHREVDSSAPKERGGGPAARARAEYRNGFAAREFYDVAEFVFHYLNLSVAKPASAKISESIQKRITTFVSAQPLISKWWCIGDIKKTRLPVLLNDAT